MWGKLLHGRPRMLKRDLFAVANLLVFLWALCCRGKRDSVSRSTTNGQVAEDNDYRYDNSDKKLSLCWQTRATRLEVSQDHQTYSTNPYVRYSFLLVCNSNFVFKTCRFSDIRLQKCRDLEIRVRGHSWSLRLYHSIDWIWSPTTLL